MKRAISLLLAAVTLGAALAPPASAAARLSLKKGEKACEAAFDKQTPPPKSATMDTNATSSNDTHFYIGFKVTSAEGRLEKFVCTVDRKSGDVSIAPRERR